MYKEIAPLEWLGGTSILPKSDFFLRIYELIFALIDEKKKGDVSPVGATAFAFGIVKSPCYEVTYSDFTIPTATGRRYIPSKSIIEIKERSCSKFLTFETASFEFIIIRLKLLCEGISDPGLCSQAGEAFSCRFPSVYDRVHKLGWFQTRNYPSSNHCSLHSYRTRSPSFLQGSPLTISSASTWTNPL
jgi:hypothetical protein